MERPVPCYHTKEDFIFFLENLIENFKFEHIPANCIEREEGIVDFSRACKKRFCTSKEHILSCDLVGKLDEFIGVLKNT